jgi:hypothetical protein
MVLGPADKFSQIVHLVAEIQTWENCVEEPSTALMWLQRSKGYYQVTWIFEVAKLV